MRATRADSQDVAHVCATSGKDPTLNSFTARRLLVVASICLAVIEVVSIALADVPLGVGIAFAALFGAAALLVFRGKDAGVWLTGVLSLVEVAGFFMYERGDAATWTLQVLALVMGSTGLVACVALLVRSRAGAHADAP